MARVPAQSLRFRENVSGIAKESRQAVGDRRMFELVVNQSKLLVLDVEVEDGNIVFTNGYCLPPRGAIPQPLGFCVGINDTVRRVLPRDESVDQVAHPVVGIIELLALVPDQGGSSRGLA